MLYNVVLISTVLKGKSGICMHMSPLFWVSFLFMSPWSPEFSELYSRFSLSIFYIVLMVYICQSQSPHSSHPLSHPLVSMFVLYLWVSLFCNKIIYTIFLDSINTYNTLIYVLIYDICFPLSDLLYSV